MRHKKKYKVVTLGCRTNQYESQAFVDQLKIGGHIEAKEGERADLCIVNSCTVTQSADRRSLYQIRKVARDYAPSILVVTGCLAERLERERASLPEGTKVLPNANKEQLLPLIFPEEEWPEFQIKQFEGRTRAFVKVQDGCNSYCSYCIIPFVRGRSRSRRVDEVIQEVEGLVEKGYKEVVLTGINIGDFDGAQEPPLSLAHLVRTVDQIKGLKRLRLSSIDPDEVDGELLDAVICGRTTCPSMHIVLQSGSNSLLKRMRRKYTKQDFMETAQRLKQADPHFTLTTDVIVGFPGESEAEFEETRQLIEEVEFAKVHLFPYSDRPKTRASRMEGKLSCALITQRKGELMRTAERAAFALREQFVGGRFPILIEEEVRPGCFMGRTPHFLPVFIQKRGLRCNTLIDVVVTGNSPEGLLGKD